MDFWFHHPASLFVSKHHLLWSKNTSIQLLGKDFLLANSNLVFIPNGMLIQKKSSNNLFKTDEFKKK